MSPGIYRGAASPLTAVRNRLQAVFVPVNDVDWKEDPAVL